MPTEKTKKAKKRHRSCISGKYVSKSSVKRHPKRSVSEVAKKRKTATKKKAKK